MVDREKPNLATTGTLMADTNVFRGVVIKYSEPAEARKPKLRWRLYPFKGLFIYFALFILLSMPCLQEIAVCLCCTSIDKVPI